MIQGEWTSERKVWDELGLPFLTDLRPFPERHGLVLRRDARA